MFQFYLNFQSVAVLDFQEHTLCKWSNTCAGSFKAAPPRFH